MAQRHNAFVLEDERLGSGEAVDHHGHPSLDDFPKQKNNRKAAEQSAGHIGEMAERPEKRSDEPHNRCGAYGNLRQ